MSLKFDQWLEKYWLVFQLNLIIFAQSDGHKDKKKEPKHKGDKAEEVKPQKAKRLPPADFKVMSST